MVCFLIIFFLKKHCGRVKHAAVYAEIWYTFMLVEQMVLIVSAKEAMFVDFQLVKVLLHLK